MTIDNLQKWIEEQRDQLIPLHPDLHPELYMSGSNIDGEGVRLSIMALNDCLKVINLFKKSEFEDFQEQKKEARNRLSDSYSDICRFYGDGFVYDIDSYYKPIIEHTISRLMLEVNEGNQNDQN